MKPSNRGTIGGAPAPTHDTPTPTAAKHGSGFNEKFVPGAEDVKRYRTIVIVLLLSFCGLCNGVGQVLERGDAQRDFSGVQGSVGNDFHELDAAKQVQVQGRDGNDPSGGVGHLLREPAALVKNGAADLDPDLATGPAILCAAVQPSAEHGRQDTDANAREREELRQELLLERQWSHGWRGFGFGILAGFIAVQLAQFFTRR